MKTKTNHPRTARSLATTLAIAFFTLSMIILLVNGSFALYTNIKVYQESIAVQQQLIAQDASKEVSTFIKEKFNTMETAVEFTNPIIASTRARETFMDGLLGSHPSFQQFVLLNERGRPLVDTAGIAGNLSPEFTAYTKDALSETTNGENFIGPIYIDDATSEPLIAIAIPVRNSFGDAEGSLMAEVNLKFMWSLVDQLEVGETGYAYVVDNQGNLIAFEDTARVLAGENASQISEVREFVENPSASADLTPEVVSYTGLTGTTVLGTYIPLGTPPWAVVIELPSTEAYRPIVQSTVASVGTILLMAILAGIAGVIVARRLAVPLVDLTGTATRIAGGEVELQAAVAGAQEVATLATAFNTMTSQLRDLISSLEQRVADRTKALAASTEVSRRLSTILDRGQLVKEVVEQVQSAFNYYHAHIYLLNATGDELVMAGGTGEAGQTMLARGHRIPKGKGLVGRAADTNTSVLVPDTLSNPDWLPNPLLPETKSEVAVPISIGDQVLGVLDVQHNLAGELNQDDADLLLSIANQVAVALQNIRQYENSQKIAVDMGVVANVGIASSTITEPGHLLQEVVELSKKSFNLYHAHIYLLNETGDSLELTSGAGEVGKQMVSEKRNIPLDSEQSLVARAARTGEGVLVNDVTAAPDFLPNPLLPDTRSEMAVPMMVAGKVIGVLDVQSEMVNHFTDVDVSIQTTLASQVAVALQNARSYSQSQRQAERETRLNAISQKIQSTTTIEVALQTAARELGHALGMKTTLVELNPGIPAGEHKNN